MRLGALVAAALSLGCSIKAPEPGAPPRTPQGAQARKLVAAGARLLDVRTSEEFREGAVPGAINLPVDQVEARAMELLPFDEPIVVYCHSGYRSAVAARALRKAGFLQVMDLGSMRNW
jgi:rhodanese-related sulfurtransferase